MIENHYILVNVLILNFCRFMFMCNKWLAVDRDDGTIERLLPAATEKDVANFEYLFFTTTQKVLIFFLSIYISLENCIPYKGTMNNNCFLNPTLQNRIANQKSTCFFVTTYTYFHISTYFVHQPLLKPLFGTGL